jgi:hypothetical protein
MAVRRQAGGLPGATRLLHRTSQSGRVGEPLLGGRFGEGCGKKITMRRESGVELRAKQSLDRFDRCVPPLRRTTRCCQTNRSLACAARHIERSPEHPHLLRLVIRAFVVISCISAAWTDTRQCMRLIRLRQQAQSTHATAPCTQRWHADPAAENTPSLRDRRPDACKRMPGCPLARTMLTAASLCAL